MQFKSSFTKKDYNELNEAAAIGSLIHGGDDIRQLDLLHEFQDSKPVEVIPAKKRAPTVIAEVDFRGLDHGDGVKDPPERFRTVQLPDVL